MLAEKVPLHDIKDVEGFVRGTIHTAQRRGMRISLDEREELVCEGLAILYQLAEIYEPHRDGYTKAGTFAGFAAMYLPRRLGDAWHAAHPEHRYVTGLDGKRIWEYDPPPTSLDDDERVFEVPAREEASEDDQVEAAITSLEPFEQIGARSLVKLHEQGFGMNDIAAMMNCSREQLKRVRIRLGQAVLDSVSAT